MPIKPKMPGKPVVYPEVNAKLMAQVYAIYSEWTPQEFADAIAQYRREQELLRKRADIELDIATLKNALDDL